GRLAPREPASVGAWASALGHGEAGRRRRIFSVELPIVTPEGDRVYRGSLVVVPPAPGDPLAAAPRGWVDLRPPQLGQWIARAGRMVEQAKGQRARDGETGSDVD